MHIVIIAGGVGSRLWPVSRETNPKPFIRMEDGRSLLQKTCLRAVATGSVESLTTVTNRDLFFRTEDEYRELALSVPLHYLLEPFGRNTAPAVCAAGLELQARYGDDALMLVLPADHLVTDEDAFVRAVARASAAAANGRLVTFGIPPSRAETAFGYIQVPEGSDLSGSHVLEVERFVEKPDREQAEQYLAGGRHLWNAGMFCFRAGTLLEELNRHAPALLQAVTAALEAAGRSEGEGHSVTRLAPESFGAVEDDSIDYALMEKSSRVSVVPCDPGWSDIGSWQAMAGLVEPDAAGNRVVGQAELEDCRDTYVRSPHRLVAAVGVEDLVIVDTADALLVARKEHSEDVKKIVQRLKANGGELHHHHVTVHRPWGTYTVLEEGERFKMKRIEVKPGASLSLQMHHHRSEHWVVVRGTARVVNGESEHLLRTDESTYIAAGHQHRLENPGILPLVMVEVQSGEYLGEDDIVRLDDSYGRS
ncbi:mannose-1-phosphate guanylyltransferase/mannose-6-phosphate isomerase [Thioalkalivibrio halophilus]|uniref:mannose-1-phosphate guanylyltransferase n=1 Tax=Thioalkalivibrio halophilus TaxID=252474 RepID=A0A1V3A2V5_9GAMM|nr:mannose-1-phosphate guanylyltransferase/mannose-6-phosphate isomerase [Thioalkalivibrio halophilus]OOC11413.1 mannose-1-phosphate guanylyltransferase/mannose-6-phosphate isomerase [Thioalkalivibrio halophilus]